MIEKQTASLLIGTTGLIAVALCTISGLLALSARLSIRNRVGQIALQDVYQDQDGAATKESTQKFSQKFHFVSLICLSITGLLVSLAQSILSIISEDQFHMIEPWLQFSIWVFVVLNATALLVEPSPIKKFTIGLYISMSTIVYIAVITVQKFFLYPYSDSLALKNVHDTLISVQFVVAFVCACISALLPRRPDVFRNGKVVDAQYTTSWLRRLTFSWPSELLKNIRRTRKLDVEYLPELDYATRARSLLESFDQTKHKSPRLWKVLVNIYLSPLVLQFVLVVIASFLNFAPQFCLLHILRALEARSRGEWNPSETWAFVFALGMSTVIYSTIESWLYWISFSKLCIPVYEQIAAVVFTKAMRRKNVKGRQMPSSTDDQTSDRNINQLAKDDTDDEDDNQKTNQGTINLIAVDAKRVSDFAAYNYFIPSTIVELATAFTFLGLLIGWKSLCSGLLVSVVVTPVNIYVSNKYTGSQISLMKLRDQKMAVITEVLHGIRQIKFSALENQWQRKIGDLRKAELHAQWTVFRCDIVLIGIWILGPVMLSAVSLGVYYLLYGELSASVAFTTVSIFSSLELTLAILPELITDFIECWVSAERIEKYLTSAEKGHNTLPSDKICFEKATISWPVEDPDETDGRFRLQDISLNFPPKGFSVISGKTGSGKSLLIASILGESDILAGIVRVPVAPPPEETFNEYANKENWIIDSAIAYVAQIPWIENATIKDNILFGLPFDQDRYHQVLFACALEKDLDMLPDGELTDIGANGINLSGGQKWRISFARALYSRAGILIMDDLFSALDAHTGRHLHLTRPNDAARQSDEVEDDIDALNPSEAGLQKVLSRGSQTQTNVVTSDVSVKRKRAPAKFQQDEWRETGSVKLAHYITYFKSGGSMWYWLFVALAFLTYITLTVGRSWWISIWTRSSSGSATDTKLFVMTHIVNKSDPESPNSSLLFYLGIYVGLSLVTCVLGPLRYGLFFNAAINASRNLFDRLTYAVLRAPLRWLDTIPVGRILNRFTADFNMIDSRLGSDFSLMLYHILQIFGIMAAGLLVSPILILFAIGLLGISLYYSLYYLDGAREIKRLESIVKSPVYEQFGTALTGLSTIRAFGKVPTYIDRMFTKIDRHAQAFWHLWLFNRWLGFRMSTIGSVFAVTTAALVVYMKGIDASLAGFALSFAMQYTNAISYGLREYTNIELNMNATERVIEYSEIGTEPQDGLNAPAAWPTEGRLEVSDLVVAYAPDLPPVLKGLSFKVEKNQRVGVVGRTGAGKSSLTLALFRFLEARGGTIHVDERVHLVSNSIDETATPTQPCSSSSPPQTSTGSTTPTLISGESSSTAAATANANIFNKLESTISEGGLNLSQGQRQLLCLARAIVSQPKIMVLDEATSAVDMATDALIQRSIRSEFGRNSSTLLVIAHRLSTIADFDRILVMDSGKAVEFGTPKDLMKIENGVFRGLVEESGERKVLEQIIFEGMT
ncbi:hypothetical protein HCAG_06237 [Histoplasma mississippiense (nom. inval.)]|uniref:hypothetical protein n=1 Tax=Ajellomyces capsulatus (strain NAm1 / WU24) TaxID=2059318 RepID=UPI000157CE2C|nr:hypothetical protein HCAG_06237 [Histoplasma mississippiense (nom. inval.)]EDN10434.1 hypothetical protein HCAG_06237 [Histoplasma mississippiense (nom. inval.)]